MQISIKLRERIGQLIEAKYSKIKKDIERRKKELEDKTVLKEIIKLGANKLAVRLLDIKAEIRLVEKSIADICEANSHWIASQLKNGGDIPGTRIDRLVEERFANSELAKKQDDLKDLRDSLIEELWLTDQPDTLRDIVSKML